TTIVITVETRTVAHNYDFRNFEQRVLALIITTTTTIIIIHHHHHHHHHHRHHYHHHHHHHHHHHQPTFCIPSKQLPPYCHNTFNYYCHTTVSPLQCRAPNICF
ncbi:MAG: hypothetical protein E6I91_11320, partial [Chloroflexi bacterium]